MQYEKPKSAPPRLKSKFVKNRTNAMKEIEAWVRKDKDSFAVPEASRMSGQLSDNVTEERMLKAKLWELSKERYKFLSQNSYEKKVFQDRQQKKAGLRRVASASSTDSRLRSGSLFGLEERRNSLDETPQRPRVKNARLALLDRLDPTKNKSRTKKANSDETNKDAKQQDKESKKDATGVDTKTKAKAAPSQSNQSRSPFSRAVSSPALGRQQQEADVNTNSSDSKNFGPNQTSTNGSRNALFRTALPHPFDSKNADDTQTEDGAHTPAPPIPPATNSAPVSAVWSKASRNEAKYGMKVESMTRDPRYASLEKTLCPLVRSSTLGDINSIVNNIESLHVRPKRRPVEPSKRSKIEVKAYNYMKEKGFAL